MTNDQPSPKVKMTKQNYDLEERTAVFSERVIDFCQKLPLTAITKPLISQLIRAATSISANYCEADEASSKRDFSNKISIAKKETKETKHWLRLVAFALPQLKDQCRELWKEAQELNLIFAAIVRKTRERVH